MPLNWLNRQSPQSLLLWAAAVILVGLALADISLFGMDTSTMAIVAAVFAALTAVYHTGSSDTT